MRRRDHRRSRLVDRRGVRSDRVTARARPPRAQSAPSDRPAAGTTSASRLRRADRPVPRDAGGTGCSRDRLPLQAPAHRLLTRYRRNLTGAQGSRERRRRTRHRLHLNRPAPGLLTPRAAPRTPPAELQDHAGPPAAAAARNANLVASGDLPAARWRSDTERVGCAVGVWNAAASRRSASANRGAADHRGRPAHPTLPPMTPPIARPAVPSRPSGASSMPPTSPTSPPRARPRRLRVAACAPNFAPASAPFRHPRARRSIHSWPTIRTQKRDGLSRALISDLVTYFPQSRDEGLRDGTLKRSLPRRDQEELRGIRRSGRRGFRRFHDALSGRAERHPRRRPEDVLGSRAAPLSERRRGMRLAPRRYLPQRRHFTREPSASERRTARVIPESADGRKRARATAQAVRRAACRAAEVPLTWMPSATR